MSVVTGAHVLRSQERVTTMPMLSKEARRDRKRRTERLAARGCHPDDGERETERWDFGL